MIRLPVIATKFLYGLFILWLGVLAPLVYFDQFATNHHVQPYRFALSEARNRAHFLPPESVASQLMQQLKQRLTHQQDVMSAPSPFSGLAHSLQWSLGQFYLVAGMTGLLLLLFGPLRLVEQLSATSADLPPPKKPPRLNQFRVPSSWFGVPS
jgi:hypothetical protein